MNLISNYFGLAGDGSVQGVGEAFIWPGGKATSIKFYLRKYSSLDQNVNVSIYNATGTYGNGAKPTGSLIQKFMFKLLSTKVTHTQGDLWQMF